MKPLLHLLLAVAIGNAAANQLAWQPNQLVYHVVPQQQRQQQQQQQQQLQPISNNLPFYVTAYAKVIEL